MLAALAARGDDSAFERLVTRYEQRVYRLVCRLASETDAPDLLQDTFMQVHRSRHVYRPDLPVRPWVFAIARHVWLMAQRTRSRRPATA